MATKRRIRCKSVQSHRASAVIEGDDDTVRTCATFAQARTVVTVAAEDLSVAVEAGPVAEDVALGEQHLAHEFATGHHHRRVHAQSERHDVAVLLPQRVEPFPWVVGVLRQVVQVADHGQRRRRRWVLGWRWRGAMRRGVGVGAGERGGREEK